MPACLFADGRNRAVHASIRYAEDREGVGLDDAAAWECLYARERARLYRVAALIVGAAEAEEVVQEAFEKAMRESAFLQRVASPAAWLRTVAVRQALMRARRREVLDRVLSALRPTTDPPLTAEDIDLRTALDSLPRRQRAAVVLRYYVGAEYEEIARSLGIAESSVGPLLTRARSSLRERLR